MSETLLTINILVIIFYLFAEKIKFSPEYKDYILYPLRIALGLLALIDLVALFVNLSPHL